MTGPEAAQKLLASRTLRGVELSAAAGQAFLTGGSLRDRLLGLPTHDLDLAVTGDPAKTAAALARHGGGRCFPLGRPPLVTWRVAGPGRQVDVWGIADGIARDIARRDFTINALFWRLPRGPLLDLVGGLDDLAARRLRVVRPENLTEDPLRVLRGIRLLATHPQLRLTAEAEGLLASAAPGLRRVARERVTSELRATLAGPGAGRALATAARIGVLGALSATWDGYEHVRDLARLAGALSRLRSGRGPLARGADDVAAAVLGAPAAGFPAAWRPEAAATALATAGWPSRAAARAADGAALGERFVAAFAVDPALQRELAAAAGELLEPALAWAVARADLAAPEPTARASALLRWRRRFDARAPLLSGDEIARLLGLAPGPLRAEAVLTLRRARARGDVRTRGQALRYMARTGAR